MVKLNDTVALVWSGFGGTTAELMPRNGCRGNVSGFVCDTDRALSSMAGRYSVPAGTPVIDKRPAIDSKGAAVSLKAPLLDIERPSAFSLKGAEPMALAMMSDPGNGYGSILAGALVGAVNLDSVGLSDYVAYWRTNGARVGVVTTEGTIDWE